MRARCEGGVLLAELYRDFRGVDAVGAPVLPILMIVSQEYWKARTHMIEVLWHGRGGQGAFTAARLLGAASSFADGAYALAFPSFGPERRGAPMRAFTKMSREPIGDRSAVSRANYVIYLDDTLFGAGWEDELLPGGVAIVNTVRAFDDPRIVAIDANGISQEILGRPIPNTALLGALCSVCDYVTAEDVKRAIEGYMPAKLHEKNKRVVDTALAAVAGAASRVGDGAVDAAVVENPQVEASVSRETEGEAAVEAPVGRGGAKVPTLQSAALDPADFAHTTCYDGGYLVAKNAGWRNMRPVLNAQKCTGCLQCYLYCPDGCVVRADGAASPSSSAQSSGAVAIDYDFCKGCGVCVEVCRHGALSMVPESEADAR